MQKAYFMEHFDLPEENIYILGIPHFVRRKNSSFSQELYNLLEHLMLPGKNNFHQSFQTFLEYVILPEGMI